MVLPTFEIKITIMAKTIDFDKNADGAAVITVGTNPPRTLFNPTNVTVKPIPGGAVLKLTDESWRQTVLLEDTVTTGGVPETFANQTELVEYLNDYISNPV